MSVQPTRDIDYREALNTLELYLKVRGKAIKGCREWARWTYSATPFWSVWGTIQDRNLACNFCFCGIQIYDDGQVLIVYSDNPLEEGED